MKLYLFTVLSLLPSAMGCGTAHAAPKKQASGGARTGFTRPPQLLKEEHMSSSNSLAACDGAITFRASGRFGDNLVALSHALWVAMQTERPLLLRSFPYSDQLVASRLWSSLDSAGFATLQPIRYWPKRALPRPSAGQILQLDYFPEAPWEAKKPEWQPLYFPVDWDNSAFRSLVRQAIQPINPLPSSARPPNTTAVAIHWRTGGNFDGLTCCVQQRMKMPDPQFFIDALNLVRQLRSHEPLFVRLFTDFPNPEVLIEILKSRADTQEIEFSARWEQNRDDANVLEDFFDMQTFDVLIRSDSNYSLMCGRLVDYQLEIYPLQATTPATDPQPHVTRIGYHASCGKNPIDSSCKLSPASFCSSIYPCGRWGQEAESAESAGLPSVLQPAGRACTEHDGLVTP
jgi:hypothetical protein